MVRGMITVIADHSPLAFTLPQTTRITGRSEVVFDNPPLNKYTILTLRFAPGIENKTAARSIDQTDDWQLLHASCANTLWPPEPLMNETTASYFRFPPDPAADDDFHKYLVASLVHIPTVPSDLSMRETIAFMCWRALLAEGPDIRDFGNPTAEAIGESDSGGGTTPQPPPSTKRPHESHGLRVTGAVKPGLAGRWRRRRQ